MTASKKYNLDRYGFLKENRIIFVEHVSSFELLYVTSTGCYKGKVRYIELNVSYTSFKVKWMFFRNTCIGHGISVPYVVYSGNSVCIQIYVSSEAKSDSSKNSKFLHHEHVCNWSFHL